MPRLVHIMISSAYTYVCYACKMAGTIGLLNNLGKEPIYLF